MTFKRSMCGLAALLAMAVTSPRPSAQAYGQCGYIWVGGGGGGPYAYGWAQLGVYEGYCGSEYGGDATVGVQLVTPSGNQDSAYESTYGSWDIDGYVDVEVSLQPGEYGFATTFGWGAISYYAGFAEGYSDQFAFLVQGGGGGEDPPPDEDPPPEEEDPPPPPPTITFSPSDYVTRDYNSDDVFVTAVVSPAGQGWEQQLYWVGDGEPTGNELERRFSTSEVRTMGATAVIGSEEATATVKIVPVVDVSPAEVTVPVHPSDYVTVFAQVSPVGEATVQWSGDGWSYPESPHIRYFSRTNVATFNAVAQAGESQPKPTQVNVVQPSAQLKLFLDVEPYNFSVGNPQSEDGIYVPGAKEDGSSVPVSEIQAGQQLRLYAAFVNQANQIVAPPANASVTFELSGNSHWAGYAMNQGSGTDEDFAFQGNFQNVAFSGDVAQVILLCKDYGGSVRVGASSNGTPAPQLRLPRDTNDNWLADIGWKATTGTGVETVPDNVEDAWSDADGDIGPIGSPVPPDGVPLNHGWYGDGLIRFHEYRGFVVQGNHVRTDPRRLDIFMSHNVARTDTQPQARLDDAFAFAKSSLNQFRVTLHELFDQTQEDFTAEYATGPGGQVNPNADAGQAIAGYVPSSTYQRALRIVNGVVPGDKWGNTTGSCGPPGQPAQSGLIPLNVSSMVVDVARLFTDGNNMPAFTTPMILNEIRKVVAHEMGHGIHISHRAQGSGQQCADSANLGGTVSVMNDDQNLNGQDASFQGSQYNVSDIRQIRLHLRPNP